MIYFGETESGEVDLKFDILVRSNFVLEFSMYIYFPENNELSRHIIPLEFPIHSGSKQ
jgi:hypothetical protein